MQYSYWHDTVICLSVHPSVTLCIVAKGYILQQVSEQMNKKCPLGTQFYNFLLPTLTPIPQTTHPAKMWFAILIYYCGYDIEWCCFVDIWLQYRYIAEIKRYNFQLQKWTQCDWRSQWQFVFSDAEGGHFLKLKLTTTNTREIVMPAYKPNNTRLPLLVICCYFFMVNVGFFFCLLAPLCPHLWG